MKGWVGLKVYGELVPSSIIKEKPQSRHRTVLFLFSIKPITRCVNSNSDFSTKTQIFETKKFNLQNANPKNKIAIISLKSKIAVLIYIKPKQTIFKFNQCIRNLKQTHRIILLVREVQCQTSLLNLFCSRRFYLSARGNKGWTYEEIQYDHIIESAIIPVKTTLTK